MPEHVSELFAEYADAYARGERPRAEDYLVRAGDQADELATMFERFVHAAPARTPDAETLALADAWITGEPPLVTLRASHGMRVEDVVDGLMNGLNLADTQRAKVKGYYQRLEGGLLEPSGVSTRVWRVLTAVLGSRTEELASWRARPVASTGVYLRADEPIAAAPPAARALPKNDLDEVDLLFLEE